MSLTAGTPGPAPVGAVTLTAPIVAPDEVTFLLTWRGGPGVPYAAAINGGASLVDEFATDQTSPWQITVPITEPEGVVPVRGMVYRVPFTTSLQPTYSNTVNVDTGS